MVGDREQEFGFLYAFAKTRLSELAPDRKAWLNLLAPSKISSPVRGDRDYRLALNDRFTGTIKPKTRPNGRATDLTLSPLSGLWS
ncbi:MAG TPA: hypothetical protein VGP76_04425 [Planctomycetaceae bacterium]|jgi:hypothetical protein|nr:hypothetical protein [Planctomycetaceae bacterium]